VGAGSVVVTSVPPNATVVGVPGHIVAFRDESNGVIQRLPDPEWERLNELDRRVQELHDLVHHIETHSNGVHAQNHHIHVESEGSASPPASVAP
jgi:serine O-acetyltransferase